MKAARTMPAMALALLALCGPLRAGEIHDAAKAGDAAKVQALLKEDPSLANSKDETGQTPLHWAASIRGNRAVAEALLAGGAEVDARDDGLDRTALHMSTDADVVELLLQYKADVNARDKFDHTPLHWAAQFGNLEVAKALLAHGADRNAQDNEGHTALQAAELAHNAEMVQLLAVPLRLKISGKAGETYFTVYQMSSRVSALDEPEDIEIVTARLTEFKGLVESHVIEVKKNGRQIVREQVTKLSVSYIHGADKLEFDSDDPASKAAAEKDPSFTPLLKLLDQVMEVEFEANGDARNTRFVSGGSPAGSPVDEDIAQPLVLLPEKAIRVMDTWDGGTRSRPFAGLGKVKIRLEGVLLDVRTIGDDQLATIGFRQTATLVADPDAKSNAELESYSGGGVARFSLNKGRITDGYYQTEGVVRITDEGKVHRVKAVTKMDLKEVEP